jgi:hypothetical protein
MKIIASFMSSRWNPGNWSPAEVCIFIVVLVVLATAFEILVFLKTGSL